MNGTISPCPSPTRSLVSLEPPDQGVDVYSLLRDGDSTIRYYMLTKTDCVNNGSRASARFVPTGERLNIPMHTCSIHHEACKTLHLQGIIHFIVYILRVFQCNDFLSQKW